MNTARTTTATRRGGTRPASEVLGEVMGAWNRVMAAAKQHFPRANEEQLYRIAKGAMDWAVFASKTSPSRVAS